MADISTELAAIQDAVYGEEVRGSIINALTKMNTGMENELGSMSTDVSNVEAYIRSSSPLAVTDPAAIVKVTTAAALSAEDVLIDIAPVQGGSGTPSSSNVRPITGWTGATIHRNSKNVLPPRESALNLSDSGIDFIVNKDGSVRVKGTASSNVAFDIPVTLVAGITYTASGITGGSSSTYSVYLQSSGGASTSAGNFNSGSKTWTQDTIGYSVGIYRIRVVGGTTIDKIFYPQIELGTEATYYEPYQDNDTYTVDWQTEAGTVYGGTFDLTTGKLTVTYENIASYNGETLPGVWISSKDAYAQGTSPSIGAQVVYAVETPTVYDLTPIPIDLVRGGNDVWANTGNTTLAYRQDVYLSLYEMITELQATVLENMN